MIEESDPWKIHPFHKEDEWSAVSCLQIPSDLPGCARVSITPKGAYPHNYFGRANYMGVGHRFANWMWGLAACMVLGLAACHLTAPVATTPTGEPFLVSPTWTVAPTQVPSRTSSGAPLQTLTVEETSVPNQAFVLIANSTPTPVFYEPAGCRQPPDDYTRVLINHYTLNNRPYVMLQQAALLYGGEIDVAG